MENLATGENLTEHSGNPVPFWYITPTNHHKEPFSAEEIAISQRRISGLLSDIAPTVLDAMQIPKPAEMSGESLLPQIGAGQ